MLFGRFDQGRRQHSKYQRDREREKGENGMEFRYFTLVVTTYLNYTHPPPWGESRLPTRGLNLAEGVPSQIQKYFINNSFGDSGPEISSNCPYRHCLQTRGNGSPCLLPMCGRAPSKLLAGGNDPCGRSARHRLVVRVAANAFQRCIQSAGM